MAFTRFRRAALAAASGALALAGVVAGSGTADASPGQTACSMWRSGIGQICVTEDANGYNAQFASTMYGKVDFNLVINTSQHVGDKGAFNVVSGKPYTYYFATGRQHDAALCLYSRDGQFSQMCTSILFG
ncbi:hypothetical protein [Streptomyces sp. 1222.5]|uniref:hypothetical protein n=1 Tax=Streptomyces sp. 1222.5 TaxID=1881026 RepID=UPI003D745EE7